MNDEIVGQVVGGDFGRIILREKDGAGIEIGSLLVSQEEDSFLIMQVFDMEYGSQIQEGMRQMMSGVSMEQIIDAKFYEPEFVNYVLAKLKPLARVDRNDKVRIPKSLPTFFSRLRLISSDDLKFLQRNRDSIFVGNIRSGSTSLDAKVWLPAQDVFSHHVLIPAATGRGKSNLIKCILWNVLDTNNVGVLVLDAHDEYYGRGRKGLKDHLRATENLAYYTPSDPPPGARQLTINLQSVEPEHFEGIVDFSDAQLQAIRTAFRKHKRDWIKKLMQADPSSGSIDGSDSSQGEFKSSTLMVVQRRLRMLLNLHVDESDTVSSRHEVFDADTRGMTTVNDIVDEIEQGRVVVLDTSRLGDEAELIVGNIIADRLLHRYKDAKARGQLDHKPVATIVIEEAPRVIGSDVLASNDNVYSTIAKEGRKFKVGLTAITQLSSVIPKTILANMNTKIILGNEMKQERDAIIASASQDLSGDDKNIASLDKGEAIITSIFVPFAMPIKIPLFDDLVKSQQRPKPEKIKVF